MATLYPVHSIGRQSATLAIPESVKQLKRWFCVGTAMVRGEERVVEAANMVPVARDRTSGHHREPIGVYWNHPAHGIIRVYHYRDGKWFPTVGRPGVQG